MTKSGREKCKYRDYLPTVKCHLQDALPVNKNSKNPGSCKINNIYVLNTTATKSKKTDNPPNLNLEQRQPECQPNIFLKYQKSMEHHITTAHSDVRFRLKLVTDAFYSRLLAVSNQCYLNFETCVLLDCGTCNMCHFLDSSHSFGLFDELKN